MLGAHTRVVLTGGLATIKQRVTRLGQAMDGNTMRWLGVFLHATQSKYESINPPQGISLGNGFAIYKSRIEN